MRILLSCLQGPTSHPVPAYGFWRLYFVQGLREAGHEVIEVPGVDWAEGLVHPAGRYLDEWRGRTWSAVEDFVKRELRARPIDLFLCYLFPRQVDVSAIRELQRLGIPCVNFFCDNLREFRKVPAEFQPFALHWVPEIEAAPLYRTAGLPYLRAPMPCWIPPDLRTTPTQDREPATFIGSADVLRQNLFGEAVQSGAELVLRGAGWNSMSARHRQSGERLSVGNTIANQLKVARDRGLRDLYFKLYNRLRPVALPPIPESSVGGPVSDDEYLRISREAVVTIGVSRVSTTKASDRKPIVYSRLRDVEAPMLGACYLTEWTEDVAALYELGTEIETYRTAEELAAKLRDLQRDPMRRSAMRRLAQRRALDEHQIPRTLGKIQSLLGLPVAA
ncbi:MAG: glycosyltransferase [Xanthobacteraceae bacterium]|jgi:hypothetical protein